MLPLFAGNTLTHCLQFQVEALYAFRVVQAEMDACVSSKGLVSLQSSFFLFFHKSFKMQGKLSVCYTHVKGEGSTAERAAWRGKKKRRRRGRTELQASPAP